MVENEKGGVYRSDDGGETWEMTNSDRSLRQRAWYYTKIYADTKDAEQGLCDECLLSHLNRRWKNFQDREMRLMVTIMACGLPLRELTIA